MKTLISLLVLNLTCFYSPFSIADSKKGAKSIFYDGVSLISTHENNTPEISGKQKSNINTEPSTRTKNKNFSFENKFMGVSYSIDLVRNGVSKGIVSKDFKFISGDQIQIRLKANRDGYVYVQHQGSSGAIKMLFPSVNQDFLVKAGTPISIPSNKMMRFDNNPGKENLWLYLSAVPLNTMQNIPNNTPNETKEISYSPRSIVSNTYTGCGSKDLLLEGVEGDMNQVNQKCGAKDLVVEDDVNGTEPTSYVVAPVDTLQQLAPIIVPITLVHN